MRNGTVCFCGVLRSLGLDLVMVQTRQEPRGEDPDKLIDVHYYTLFWLVSPDDTSTERRLQFYRFYLSRISPLKAVQVSSQMVFGHFYSLIEKNSGHEVQAARTTGFQ